jgi:hypothetical protein
VAFRRRAWWCRLDQLVATSDWQDHGRKPGTNIEVKALRRSQQHGVLRHRFNPAPSQIAVQNVTVIFGAVLVRYVQYFSGAAGALIVRFSLLSFSSPLIRFADRLDLLCTLWPQAAFFQGGDDGFLTASGMAFDEKFSIARRHAQ